MYITGLLEEVQFLYVILKLKSGNLQLDFLIPLKHQNLLKKARHNIVKIYCAFFPKKCMFYLPPFQSTYGDIIKLILQQELGQLLIMLKNILHLYYHAYFFHKKYLTRSEDSIKYVFFVL